jgi:MFS superfamily sulfate permease-like transporter
MKMDSLLNDLKASLVVFLVALPLCLGVALASNTPLSSGIIAGIIGGVVVGFLSHSQISVSGPAAGLTVIVAGGISQLGGFQNFGLAVFLSGLMQILFGLLRGGRIGDYFPTSVIKGMLAAIGLILIVKQLPNALGIAQGEPMTQVHVGTILISMLALAIMLTWDQLAQKGIGFFKMVPGALVAVVATLLVNLQFQLVEQQQLVTLPSDIFSGLEMPNISNLNFGVFSVALSIAVVASLETLLCIDAADKIDPEKRKTNKNRELFAQGLGNGLCGLIGGLPITAVIVRTSANVSAGAKTKLSAVFHGGWLVLCVLLIPGLLNLIPLSTLACVLLLVGYKLSKPSFFVEMSKRGWDQFIIYCVTIAAILATDLLKGIFAGFILAVILELRKPAFNCLEVVHEDNHVHFKFVKNVSFLHKAHISQLLAELPEGKGITFHGLNLVRVHVDVHELIREYHDEAKKKNKIVSFN